LAIAEAQYLSGVSLQALRVTACLATQSFAVARAISLWPHISADAAAETYDQTRRLLRNNGLQRGPEIFRPVWQVLSALSTRANRNRARDFQLQQSIEVAERLIAKAGAERVAAAQWIFEPIASHNRIDFRAFEKSAPEQRLNIFDALVSELNNLAVDSREYASIAMQAGFVATVAAGGAPSLSLAEGQMHVHPMVLGWAYALGGLGERVTWTSSFDGLGRLVARELARPFHIIDPPTCDFDFNELKFLVDPDLKDPLVHLRIKQSRSVQVALFPGVNVVFSFAETSRIEKPERSVAAAPQTTNFLSKDLLPLLADALAPYLERRMSKSSGSTRAKTTSKKKGEQGRTRTLPFPKK
jgi:hypothetical protein